MARKHCQGGLFNFIPEWGDTGAAMGDPGLQWLAGYLGLAVVFVWGGAQRGA